MPLSRASIVRSAPVARPIPLTVRPPARRPGEPEEPPPPPPDFSALREEAERLGYSAGYEAGYAAGLAEAEAQMAEAVARLAGLVRNVREDHAGYYRAAERQVIDLALDVAQKVVEREVEDVPDLAVGVIRAALEELDDSSVVRVRVNPEDEEVVRRRWSSLAAPFGGADRVDLLADSRVQAGGAVLETAQGRVDAQLLTKLGQLGKAVRAVPPGGGADEEAEAGGARGA